MDYDNTEVRRLSSAWTPVYKLVVPIVWITVFGVFTLSLFIDPALFEVDESTVQSRWQIVVMVCAGIAFFYWLCMRVKTVDLRGDTLFIRGLQTEIAVPLQNVERFSGSVFLNPELIWSISDSPPSSAARSFSWRRGGTSGGGPRTRWSRSSTG